MTNTIIRIITVLVFIIFIVWVLIKNYKNTKFLEEFKKQSFKKIDVIAEKQSVTNEELKKLNQAKINKPYNGIVNFNKAYKEAENEED